MSGGCEDPSSQGRALVGYGQPPVQHRFKPGKSGNPKGRPRKRGATSDLPPAISDSLAVDIALLQEAYRPIQLREGETALTISTVSAVYRAMAVSAVKGNRLAQQAFADRVQQAETRRRARAMEIIDIAAEYKYGWTPIFDDHAKRGLPPPAVLPHPGDMIEGTDGMPYVVGPQTEPEQRHWDGLQERAEQSDLSIRQNLADLKVRSKQKYREFIFDEMVYEHRMRSILRHAAPSAQTRRKLGYRRPTRADMDTFHAAVKQRYRLFKELTEAEQRSFIWQMERYDRELLAGNVP